MNVETIRAYDIHRDCHVFIFRRGERTLFSAFSPEDEREWSSLRVFEDEMVKRANAYFDREEARA